MLSAKTSSSTLPHDFCCAQVWPPGGGTSSQTPRWGMPGPQGQDAQALLPVPEDEALEALLREELCM